MDDPEDPLDGRDVGETVTVSETKEFHAIDFAPDVFYGSDRLSDYDISDVEVTKDEYGDNIVEITWDGEVTKRLPRRWDYHREPVTVEEKRKARRKSLLKKAGNFGSLVLGFVISASVGVHVMNSVAGDITVNGQALEPLSTGSIVSTFFVVGVLAFVIHMAATGRLPRRV